MFKLKIKVYYVFNAVFYDYYNITLCRNHLFYNQSVFMLKSGIFMLKSDVLTFKSTEQG